jgi:Ca2+-binding EF-hand superfamily protein
MSKKEMNEIRKTFEALDKNGDGKLSKEELMIGYS